MAEKVFKDADVLVLGGVNAALFTRIDRMIIEELKKYPTPNIADAMDRFRVMDPGMRPVSPGDFVVGPAVTVMCAAGDNLMFHKALQLAQFRNVIAGNYFGTSNTAAFRGPMVRTAKEIGIAGLIIDGAERDAEDFKELKMSAFSRTVVASRCFKDGLARSTFSFHPVVSLSYPEILSSPRLAVLSLCQKLTPSMSCSRPRASLGVRLNVLKRLKWSAV